MSGFGCTIQEGHPQTGWRCREDTETVGLEPLSCKERLWDGGWSARRRDGFGGIPSTSTRDGEDAAGLFTAVHGGRVRGSSTS